MDLLDRIAAVLRTLLGTTDGPPPRPADPDLAAAWDELNDFLGEGRRDRGERRAQNGGHRRGGSAPHPESLRADYANLEVPFGADFGTVRQSYRRLALRYHPDRHAGSAEKARVATEISKRINASFERLRIFHEATGTGRH